MNKIEFNNIYNIDCIERMKGIDDDSIDRAINGQHLGKNGNI
ncbi:MAG: hypothetical protein ACP5T0_04530 [Verrucomicrobiia bacterium]